MGEADLSRSVLVTGGARGIGRAVVGRFASAGDSVAVLGRDEGALERLPAELHSGVTGPIATFVCDITDEDAVSRVFSDVGRVDVLVNNAGFAESAALERTTLESWQRHFAVNATGAFLCTRAALPGMRERGRGAIVTVASTAALQGTPYTAAYAASKHAAVGLMRAVAAEVAGTEIRVNAVCPTFVDTPMTTESVKRIVASTGRSAEESEALIAQSSPLGRLLAPQEVADAVFWLASEEARPINAQTLVIDGGGIQT